MGEEKWEMKLGVEEDDERWGEKKERVRVRVYRSWGEVGSIGEMRGERGRNEGWYWREDIEGII